MNESTLFLRFGTALAIGALVGLQREFASDNAHKPIAAGIRTFPLFALIGCSGALLADHFQNAWLLVSVIFVSGFFFAVNYYVEAKSGRIGMTTKAAAMITLLSGALCYSGSITVAVALAVATTALLSVKIELHAFVHHLTRDDIYATLKFAAITAIILPVLPNHQLGPGEFAIFNPFKIWLFVVLISGISFIGYVLIKVAGSRTGIGLTGLLGGLASSTAVTLSLTRRSQQNPAFGRSFALAITLAWTVMFARVLAAVAILNAGLVQYLWIPVVASIAVGLAYCIYLWTREKLDKEKHSVPVSNPFELGLAIKFGLLFVIILFVSKAALVYFGTRGIYLSSFVSGLADVDAIALSMAKLSRAGGGVDATVAARAIIVATVANTLLKGVLVMAGGSRGLRRAIVPAFALMVITGLVVVFLV
jgi:uncharacterized membrane protein (DUF4010 family)